jgi:hypothetical protein
LAFACNEFQLHLILIYRRARQVDLEKPGGWTIEQVAFAAGLAIAQFRDPDVNLVTCV